MRNNNFNLDFQTCRILLERAENQAEQGNLKRTSRNIASLKAVIDSLMIKLEELETEQAQGGENE